MVEDFSAATATLRETETPKASTSLIRQTLVDVSQGIHDHKPISLQRKADEAWERLLREGHERPYLKTVFEYTSALAHQAEKNQRDLARLYNEEPDLKGREGEYLLFKSLALVHDTQSAKSLAATVMKEAGDDITFNNTDGILTLEITQRGRDLLRTASLFKGNVIGLFVRLEELPFIIVPKEDFDDGGVTVHELHHLAWNALRKEQGKVNKTHFEQAQDEVIAYILGDSWLNGAQSVNQLVYDQNFTLNGVPGDVIQMTEESLFYALICQRISQGGAFVDDVSLAGLMQANRYEDMYQVFDRYIPEATQTTPESIFTEKNVWNLFRLYQLRERISRQEKKELINFFQAFSKLRERKHIDRKTLDVLFKQTAAKILLADLEFYQKPEEDHITATNTMSYYSDWDRFNRYTLGDASDLSMEAFIDTLKQVR